MSRTQALALLAVVLFALALRLWLLQRLGPPAGSPDAENYSQMAYQLLRTGVYGYKSGQPNAYVTPGYPLFLAAIYAAGGGARAVQIIQALLGALTLLPLALLARELIGSKAALITALVLAFYPAWLRAPAYLLTEVLFTFLFAAYLWVQWQALKAWERPLWPVLAGIALGLAVLVRPVLAPLLPLPWLYLMLQLRSLRPWRAAAWAVAGFVLVMLPWWVRNLIVLDRLILFATQTGNPILGGMDPYDLWQGKLWSGVGPDTGDQMRRAGEIFTWLLRNYPGLTLRWFTVGKLSRIFLTPWLSWELPTLSPLHAPLVYLGWLGALAGLWRRHPVRPLSWTLLLLTLIQLAFIPENRYAYPLIGPLAITASLALLRIFGDGGQAGGGAGLRGGDGDGRRADPDSGL